MFDPWVGGADRVTVQPGEEVAVRQILDLGCARLSAGTAFSARVIPLDAQTLGLTRRVALPLPSQFTIRTTVARPGC